MEGRAKTKAAVAKSSSPIQNYMDVIVGKRSWLALLYFELCVWMAGVPGALGLSLRSILWPRLFRSCGKGAVFGTHIVLRHPGRIDIGDRVVISEGCILDARNDDADPAISLGDDVILSNGVMISCKGGTVALGEGVGLGPQTIIHAVNGCHVTIGPRSMVGPRCYFAGGGNYKLEEVEGPVLSQGLRDDEIGVTVDADVWLGANVTVLPSVTMGRGSVAAAGAVLTKSIGENDVAAGVPAKIVKVRGGG